MPTHAVANEPRFLRPKRIATMYGVSLSLVYKAIHDGDLPATKFRDRVWLIEPTSAEAWIRYASGSTLCNCGQWSEYGDRFCASCGQRIGEPGVDAYP